MRARVGSRRELTEVVGRAKRSAARFVAGRIGGRGGPFFGLGCGECQRGFALGTFSSGATMVTFGGVDVPRIRPCEFTRSSANLEG